MDRVNVYPNQRIGITDYENGAGGKLVRANQLREARSFILPTGRTTGAAATSARILGGFNFDTISYGVDTTATLNRGTGILPFLDESGNLLYGYVSGGEGATSIIVDFSAAAPSSTQAVWVRLTQTAGEFGNRVFWNPTGSGSEFVDNIGTQLLMGWEAVIQDNAAAAPGNGEYVKIWEVVLNGSNQITSITDRRHLYFEGDQGSSLEEWGAGNDRSTARGTYGVQDLHMWVQAVNKQLDSIIGQTGWYKAPPLSLTDLGGASGRLVTVDQPGGPGGDGDYATLEAAVTALTATNGGVILLKSGIYSITASMAITKKIGIWGIEGGTTIQNALSAGSDFVLDFQAGSDGSELIGVNLDESASSNERALKVQARFTAKHCTIVGLTHIVGSANQQIVFDNCDFSESGYITSTDEAVKIDGSGAWVTFNLCRISGSSSVTDALYISAGVASSYYESSVKLDNCIIRANGSRGLAIVSCKNFTAINTLFVGLEIPDGGTNGRTLIESGNGNFALYNCTALLEATGITWSEPLIEINNIASDDKVIIDGLRVDLNEQMSVCSNFYDAPIYIECYSASIRGLEVHNIKLPNSTTNSNSFNVVELNPSIYGSIHLDSCVFREITFEGSSHSISSIVGNHISASNTGAIVLTNCVFDGQYQTYYNTNATSCMVYLAGACESLIVSNCQFIGGYWYAALVTAGQAVKVLNNRFVFDTLTSNLKNIVKLTGPGTSTISREGFCEYIGNSIAHRALDYEVVLISSFYRASVTSNQSVSVSLTASVGIKTTLCGFCIMYANSCYSSISRVSNTFDIPVTLTDHNFSA